MKLYEVHYKDQQTHIDSFHKYMNLHVTIIFALLTVFISGMLQFYREPFSFALVGIPFYVMIFSEIGRKTIDRFYRRFLESIVIVAKIENILGFDGSLAAKKSRSRKPLWVDDKTFLPARWVEHRYECQSSAEFISKRRRMGIFQYANRAFVVLEITGLVFTLSSLLVLLHVHGFLN